MLNDGDLEFFAKYIEKELGIIYAADNYFQLRNRLEDIAKLRGIDSIEKLHVLAKAGITGDFRQLLLDVATNNETSFFRDEKLFGALKNSLLPELSTRGPIRIWSAACSSGQEALSVAITLLEASRTSHFKIIGTDVSDRILQRARLGLYSQLEVQRGMPSSLLVKYFEKNENDLWQAKAELRQRIEYGQLNLLEPFPADFKFDLILCRNVLIYQNLKRKAEILDRIQSALTPGGYLALGAAESLIGLTDAFTTVKFDGAVLYRNRSEAIIKKTIGVAS